MRTRVSHLMRQRFPRAGLGLAHLLLLSHLTQDRFHYCSEFLSSSCPLPSASNTATASLSPSILHPQSTALNTDTGLSKYRAASFHPGGLNSLALTPLGS